MGKQGKEHESWFEKSSTATKMMPCLFKIDITFVLEIFATGKRRCETKIPWKPVVCPKISTPKSTTHKGNKEETQRRDGLSWRVTALFFSGQTTMASLVEIIHLPVRLLENFLRCKWCHPNSSLSSPKKCIYIYIWAAVKTSSTLKGH